MIFFLQSKMDELSENILLINPSRDKPPPQIVIHQSAMDLDNISISLYLYLYIYISITISVSVSVSISISIYKTRLCFLLISPLQGFSSLPQNCDYPSLNPVAFQAGRLCGFYWSFGCSKWYPLWLFLNFNL